MGNININGSGSYSSLESAMNSASTNDTINVTGTWSTPWDNTQVNFDVAGVTITADSDSTHPGYAVASPTHYAHRITGSGTSDHSFVMSVDGTIEKIEIGSENTGTSVELFRINANGVDLTVKRCLLYFKTRNSEQDIYYTNAKTTLTVAFENCHIWNAQRAVIDKYATATNDITASLNSCHCYNIGQTDVVRVGIYGGYGPGTESVEMFNCCLHLNTASNVFKHSTASAVGTATWDRCISNVSDYTSINWDTENDSGDNTVSASWDDTPAASAVVPEDITSSSNYYDLRLQDDAYNIAQDAHSDASADSPGALSMPTTDIVGTSRATAYEIGGFTIAAAGGLGVPIAAYHHFHHNLA